jgi:hypothetical protein
MRRPLERTVAFARHSQDTSLANRFIKAGVEPQVIAERNIHLGELWLVKPYASGTMQPAQNSFRSRSEVIKDFLILWVEVLAPRQGVCVISIPGLSLLCSSASSFYPWFKLSQAVHLDGERPTLKGCWVNPIPPGLLGLPFAKTDVGRESAQFTFLRSSLPRGSILAASRCFPLCPR